MNENSDLLPNLLHEEFEMQMRGYSRRQVDDFVARRNSEIRELEQRLGRSLDETEHLRREVTTVRQQALAGRPAHEEVSERIAQILKLADEEANAQRGKAGDDIAKQRADAQQESDRVRADAREQAERMLTAAQEQAERTISASRNEADKTRTGARNEAERLTTETRKKAESYKQSVDFDFLMEDWDAWGNDMMLVNVTKDAVKRYMEEHSGQLPPGISISHFQRLNIKRS